MEEKGRIQKLNTDMSTEKDGGREGLVRTKRKGEGCVLSYCIEDFRGETYTYKRVQYKKCHNAVHP